MMDHQVKIELFFFIRSVHWSPVQDLTFTNSGTTCHNLAACCRCRYIVTILKIWTQSHNNSQNLDPITAILFGRVLLLSSSGPCVHRLILRAMLLADLNQNPSLSSRQASKLWPITCKITCTTATIQNNYNISVCGILYNDVRHSCSDLLVKTQTSVIRLSFNMFLCYCMKYLCIRMTTKTRCFSGINYQTIPV